MLQFFGFLVVASLLGGIIFFLTFLINNYSADYEKSSSYECGFEPFGDARSFFDVQFYIVGLLFIIFDLEVVFLVPLVAGIGAMSLTAVLAFFLFMAILIIGFYFEWALGLLSWV